MDSDTIGAGRWKGYTRLEVRETMRALARHKWSRATFEDKQKNARAMVAGQVKKRKRLGGE